jgi:RsiW-degrading membrane proteinase PrsW (M82 family)
LIKIDSISSGVLYAIFVALWFAMIENILYFYNFYLVNWFSSDFLKLYFFRSIFSIVTHLLASSILAYFFTKAYLLYKNNVFNINYLKIFIIWLFLSILSHLLFDVSLSLWFNFIIIFYLVW